MIFSNIVHKIRWITVILILSSLIVFCEFLGNVNPIYARDLSAVFKNIKPGVVTILTDKGQGSGFCMSEHSYIVTNDDVINGASKSVIKTYKGDVLSVAQVLVIDSVNDFVILESNFHK